MVPHGLVGRLLVAQVDGGLDGEAAVAHQVPALVRGAAERGVRVEVVERVAAEQGHLTVDAAVVGLLRLQPERPVLGAVCLLLGDRAELGHPVQHDVAPLDRQVVAVGRVELRRVLHEPGQRGGLVEVELACVDAEEVLGRGLDAVGAVAEVGGVQVALEDPVLRVLLLQGDREPQLAHLACVAVVGGGRDLLGGVGRVHQGQLHQLLGDRGAALRRAAGGLVGHEGPEGAADVEGTVLVEAGVLDRHDGLAHDLRDVLQPHVQPVLVVDRGDDPALAVEDPRLLRQVLGLELLREVVHRLGGLVGGEAEQAGERDREAGGDDAEHRGDDDHHGQVRDHLAGAGAFGTGPGHA